MVYSIFYKMDWQCITYQNSSKIKWQIGDQCSDNTYVSIKQPCIYITDTYFANIVLRNVHHTCIKLHHAHVSITASLCYGGITL